MNSIDVDPEYQKILDKADKKNKDVFISNSCLGHAVYATELILNRSNNNNEFKMFSGQLKGDFYDTQKMRAAFKNAIGRGTKIRIVVEKIGNKKFLEFAKKEKKIEVSVLKESKEKLGLKDFGHFLLVGSAFRIEKPHPLEKVIAEGVVNFNNREIANLLSTAFDVLIENSKKIN